MFVRVVSVCRKYAAVFAFTSGTLFSGVEFANADTLGISAKTGVGGYFINLPEYTGPFVRTNDPPGGGATQGEVIQNNLETHDGKDNGLISDFSLGDFSLELAGETYSLSLTGFYTSFDSTEVSDFSGVNADNLLGWVNIDGSIPFSTAIFAFGDPIRTRVNRETKFGGIDAMLVDAELLDGGSWRLKGFAGPSWVSLGQDFNVFAYESNRPVSATNSTTLTESLDSDYYGAVVGGTLQTNLTENLSMTISSRVGAYWMQTNYDGSQVVDGLTVDDANVSLSASDNKTTIGFKQRVELEAKITQQITLSVYGGFDYLKDVARMDYASPGERLFGLGVTATTRAARIAYEDAIGWSVGGKIGIKF